MQAVIVREGNKGEVAKVDKPTIEDGQILVKVEYAALNPTDWKHLDSLSPADVLLGCDFCGTVVESKSPLQKVGARVAGIVHGGKYPDLGSFAEYLKVDAEMVFNPPESIKSSEAATYGIGFLTACLAVFQNQKNPLPPAKQSGWFLVQGGSTSVGLFAVQLAKAIGYKVVATASPKNFDLVKSYGADEVVDYHDVDAAIKEIKRLTSGDDKGVVGALECAGGFENTRLAVESFGPKGGVMSSILMVTPEMKEIRKDVSPEGILLYMIGGYSFEFFKGKPPIPAVPELRKWFVDLAPRLPKLVEDYKIKPNPVDERKGIENILPALDELRTGKVSAKKIVVKIA